MPRDDSHCREPAACRACGNPSTPAGVRSCPRNPRSTNHRLRCAISCSWPAAELGYRPGRELRRRWDAASPAARARGQAANRRLHDRWTSFDKRKKRPMVTNAAIARELAGWCWSLAVLND